jgi:hypothetical protein
MKKFLFLVAAVISTLSGCATITGGTRQTVSVETMQDGKEVQGASCKLTNEKGTWYVKTPDSVRVHRAYGDLTVKCSKEGYKDSVQSFQSSAGGRMYGNILIGGIIGAAIDSHNGAGYDYQDLMTINLEALSSK